MAMTDLNATHDPGRRSFVESANQPDTDFPIQNLPFGIFRRGQDDARGGVAIGDQVLDLRALCTSGLLSEAAAEAACAASGPRLNDLLALGNRVASALRARLVELLAIASPHRAALSPMLVPAADIMMQLPTEVGNFTDFLTSSYHSTRLRPDSTLAPNFMSMPIAYHSRASSVRLCGEVRRPNVQQRIGDEVTFGPTLEMDYELELGAFVGPGNGLGEPLPLDVAREHVFGLCLLNDWSVRDVQRWENTPLGPFLAKSLSTTISPWVVTEEALRPFRVAAFHRGHEAPPLLPYLSSAVDQAQGGFDIRLEALLRSPAMRDGGEPGVPITDTNFRHMYWTFAQMFTHHMSNGCNLQPGDLLGSGTVSGPTPESRACLAELTARGTKPLTLPNGEIRSWLLDGDEVVFRGRASRPGFVSIGFGECRATVAPAVTWPT